MKRPHLTFFCELDSNVLGALFGDPEIALLTELEASVSLGILDLSTERAGVVRRLNEAGIPVIAWLLLPKEQGYWLNIDNCLSAAGCYDGFQAWTAQYGLQWAGMGLDIEPDIAFMQDLARFHTSRGRLFWKLLRQLLNFRKFRSARDAYHALIARMRRDGYRVESYQFPFVIDERKSRSTLLQRLIGTFDVRVDKEVLMLYSSFVRPFGSGLIWSYAPQAGAVALGSTGGGVNWGQVEGWLNTTPLSWKEFVRDLRLAWAHTGDIYVFSLEGCVRQGFLHPLRRFEWDQPILEPEETAVQVDTWRKALSSVLWAFAHPLTVAVGAAGLFIFILWLRRNRHGNSLNG